MDNVTRADVYCCGPGGNFGRPLLERPRRTDRHNDLVSSAATAAAEKGIAFSAPRADRLRLVITYGMDVIT